MTFRFIVIILLTSALPASALVAWNEGVRTLRHAWRRPDSALALIFCLDGMRRAVLLMQGYPYPYPGPVLGPWTIVSLSLIAFVFWARAIQILRHRERNNEQRKQAVKWLSENP